MTKPKLVTDSPAGLIHRVLEPAGDDPHPTILMLQGKGGTEDVMWIFARSAPKNWLLVAPRAIHNDSDGGHSWYPPLPERWPTLAHFDPAVDRLHHFIHTLPSLYNADLSRLYLMGFSQGAAASYALAIHHPQLVQGIAGLVGFIPTHCDDAITIAPLTGLPIFMAVGLQDDTIPPERAQACANTLRLAGADLDYNEYDTGHKLNSAGMRDLAAWWDTIANQ